MSQTFMTARIVIVSLALFFTASSALAKSRGKTRYRSAAPALKMAKHRYRNWSSAKKISLHGEKAYATPLVNPTHLGNNRQFERELRRRAKQAGYPKKKWVDFAIRNLNSAQEISRFMEMMSADLGEEALDDLYETIFSVMNRERHVPGTGKYWSAGMTNQFRAKVKADQANQ